MIITNSLGSNYTAAERKLAFRLLLEPSRWQFGQDQELLKNAFLKWGEAELFFKGRQAIEAALRQIGLGPGDEVMVQAFTCVAVVQPIIELQATPVYVDVEGRSLNPSIRLVESKATKKTKAIILQHTLGYVNPDNEKIVNWAASKGVVVIQDLTHAWGAPGFFKKVQPRQTRLDLKKQQYILSFSQDKAVDGVSGGALLSSLPPKLANRWGDSIANLLIFRYLTYPLITYLIRSTYNLGPGKLVHWATKNLGLLPSPIEAGSQPQPLPNALAAMARQQLERRDEITLHRREIALQYAELIDKKLKIVAKKEVMQGVNLRYPIWVNNRQDLQDKLKQHNFYLLDHWYDAPVASAYLDIDKVKYQKSSCPDAERLSRHIFNLPTHVNISVNEARRLARLVNKYAIFANSKKVRPSGTERANFSRKKKWERYVAVHPRGNFLQSWAWGELHRRLGKKIYRISVPDKRLSLASPKDNPSKTGQFLAIVEEAKRGKYLTIPGGPLLDEWKKTNFSQAVHLMKEAARRENCVFIRIRPQIEDSLRHRRLICSLGFRPAPMHLHAELTRVLDLGKSEEQLLAEMKKNTRYEIKKAKKTKLKVRQTTDEKYIDVLDRLQLQTAKRQGFVPFPQKYLLEQFRAFHKERAVKLFYVTNSQKRLSWRTQGQSFKEVVSIALIIFYHDEAVYHYSASSEAARKIPAAYAIQWAVIQEAKKRGMKTYNLWGDVPDDRLGRHRFSGPSLFKRGFGGEQISYFPAHDLPLRSSYWLNWGIEMYRKKTRRL